MAGPIYDAAMARTPTPQHREHEDWLLELTGIPTAAGHEHRVTDWVERWCKRRRSLRLDRDDAGNLLITQRRTVTGRPTLITAHMDHPAFVVHDVQGDRDVVLEFRGGVADRYFEGARIEIFDQHDSPHRATIESLDANAKPFKRVAVRLSRSTDQLQPSDIGRWILPNHARLPVVRKGIFHSHACDDLAAVAAALAALDIMRRKRDGAHVGVLLTRAEEVGFVGALACCDARSVPDDARLICLENSRSFAESPIGAGPILRVGDKSSVFGPTLTNHIAAIMAEYARDNPSFRWQRKLMPGGTCEATAFSAYGYESTCLCLPLGNYHNMQDIDGAAGGPAKVGAEHIAVADYHGLITMLEVVCTRINVSTDGIRARLAHLLDERRFVLAS